VRSGPSHPCAVLPVGVPALTNLLLHIAIPPAVLQQPKRDSRRPSGEVEAAAITVTANVQTTGCRSAALETGRLPPSERRLPVAILGRALVECSSMSNALTTPSSASPVVPETVLAVVSALLTYRYYTVACVRGVPARLKARGNLHDLGRASQKPMCDRVNSAMWLRRPSSVHQARPCATSSQSTVNLYLTTPRPGPPE